MRRASADSSISLGTRSTQPFGKAISIPSRTDPVEPARSGSRPCGESLAGAKTAGTKFIGAAGSSVAVAVAAPAAAGANSFFQRNSCAGATRCRRATVDTDPSRSDSATIAAFSLAISDAEPSGHAPS